MTETDEKPAERRSAKQGLHGWKAALAVFGCGSIAGIGVFAVVSGILGSFLSVLSDGVESDIDPPGVPQGTGAPMEDFNEEAFDFCDIIHEIAGMRLDYSDGGNIEDTSTDGGAPSEDDLVRSDSCVGELTPEGADATERWGFEFSYRATIFSPDGDREELARQDYEEWVQEAESSSGGVESSGEARMGDESRYVHGRPEGGGVSEYSVVALKRSAVFEMKMTSQNEVPLRSFEAQALQFNDRLDHDFGIFIPG